VELVPEMEQDDQSHTEHQGGIIQASSEDAFRIGFSTALSGVIPGLTGTGQLEEPTLLSSLLWLLIWLVEALGQ
jgi:hypothetical protein